jgi:hypothetical protein
MQSKAGLSIVAVILLAGGCGGSGGADPGRPPASTSQPPPPPSPPPPSPPPTGGGADSGPSFLSASCEAGADQDGARGGIWIGSGPAADPGEARLLIAETGEFHWLSPSGWDQRIFGTFRTGNHSLESDDAIWVWWSGLTWLETEFVGVDLTGELDADSNLSLAYETASDPASHGTLSFVNCNSVYTRDSSLATIAGTYIDGEQVLAIDSQGDIFLQDRTCSGGGKVELIDPDFNMYRMELAVSACAGNEVYAIGSTFSGLAYLSDSGPGFTGDTLEYSLTSTREDRALIWTRRLRR